jgi:hypothetical protein
MSARQPILTSYKRQRHSKKSILREGDVDAADAVTHEEIEVPSRRGTRTKRVKVALTDPSHQPADTEAATQMSVFPADNEIANEISSYVEPPKRKVSVDIQMEWVVISTHRLKKTTSFNLLIALTIYSRHH